MVWMHSLALEPMECPQAPPRCPAHDSRPSRASRQDVVGFLRHTPALAVYVKPAVLTSHSRGLTHPCCVVRLTNVLSARVLYMPRRARCAAAVAVRQSSAREVRHPPCRMPRGHRMRYLREPPRAHRDVAELICRPRLAQTVASGTRCLPSTSSPPRACP